MTEPTLKTSSSSSPPSPLSFITVVQASTLNIRVQGGTVASPRQFPHIISIQYQTQPGAAFEHTCGGTIISSKFILTASHCNFESDGSVVSPSKLSIVYGTNVLSDCPSSQIGTFPKCQRVAVKRVMNHAQYNEQLVVNDIALYELATPISNLPLAHIAKIPRKNPQLQTPHYIVGWGITSDASGVASNEQRVGVAPLVDDSNCNKLGLGMSSSNGQLCAGNGDGVDACVGDSGGGLSFKPKNDTQFVVSGVVSYGPSGCGVPSSVSNRGVYTSVAYFRNWIETQVNGTSPLYYYDGTGGSDDSPVTEGKNQINEGSIHHWSWMLMISVLFVLLHTNF